MVEAEIVEKGKRGYIGDGEEETLKWKGRIFLVFQRRCARLSIGVTLGC